MCVYSRWSDTVRFGRLAIIIKSILIIRMLAILGIVAKIHDIVFYLLHASFSFSVLIMVTTSIVRGSHNDNGLACNLTGMQAR